jgi:hypothetical protein
MSHWLWDAPLATIAGIFKRMPVVGQWAALSVGKSFLASILMSFLANYATAAFALRNGFRVPVEGVPYLTFAIGLATFFAFMCTLAMFGAVMSGFYYIRLMVFLQKSRRAHREEQMSDPVSRELLLAEKDSFYSRLVRFNTRMENFVSRFDRLSVRLFRSPVFLSAGLSAYVLTIWSLFEWGRAAQLVGSWLPVTPSPSVVFFSIALPAAAFIGIWCAARQYSWIAGQVIATAMIFGVFSAGLFAPDVYGSFLRIIRSGGGIAITALVRQKNDMPPATRRGNMLLLTQSHLLMMGETKPQISEVPLSELVSIEYDIHPAWKLPDYDIARQGEFIRMNSH